jgi:transposase
MTLTLEQKRIIICKYNVGKTVREIAKEMKINKNTVNKWTKQYKEEGNLKRKRGSGFNKKNAHLQFTDDISGSDINLALKIMNNNN